MKKTVSSLTIKEMMELSEKLYKIHEHDWMKKTPESNIYWISWLVGEVGEVIDIIKKKGVDKIMNDKSTRLLVLFASRTSPNKMIYYIQLKLDIAYHPAIIGNNTWSLYL